MDIFFITRWLRIILIFEYLVIGFSNFNRVLDMWTCELNFFGISSMSSCFFGIYDLIHIFQARLGSIVKGFGYAGCKGSRSSYYEVLRGSFYVRCIFIM